MRLSPSSETRAPASHLPGPAAMRVGMTRAALIVGALSGGAAGCSMVR